MKLREVINEIEVLKEKIKVYDYILKGFAKLPEDSWNEGTKEKITKTEIAMVKTSLELNRYYEMEVLLVNEGERYEANGKDADRGRDPRKSS